MIKKLLLLSLGLTLVLQLKAQDPRHVRYWEFGGFLGTMNYSGDMTEGGFDNIINEMRPQMGIFLKRNTSAKFNINAELAYGKVYASDKNHGNPERAFEVNTNLLWANIGFELNFKKFGKYFRKNGSTPYIGVGAGVLYYNPKLAVGPYYDPSQYELYYGTDGTYNIMFAFGWKWRMSEYGVLGLSINYHTTGTSHIEGFQAIDGVSSMDNYFGLRLAYSHGFYSN